MVIDQHKSLGSHNSGYGPGPHFTGTHLPRQNSTKAVFPLFYIGKRVISAYISMQTSKLATNCVQVVRLYLIFPSIQYVLPHVTWTGGPDLKSVEFLTKYAKIVIFQIALLSELFEISGDKANS